MTVKASAPEIEGSAPSDVQDTTAKFNGNVTKTGGDFPSVFVYYGKAMVLTILLHGTTSTLVSRAVLFQSVLVTLLQIPPITTVYRLQTAGTVWDGAHMVPASMVLMTMTHLVKCMALLRLMPRLSTSV